MAAAVLVMLNMPFYSLRQSRIFWHFVFLMPRPVNFHLISFEDYFFPYILPGFGLKRST